MIPDRKTWASTRLEAIIWWCGDDECDCTQPQIDRVTPNLSEGYPWIRRETVWRGTFHSKPDADQALAQRAELAVAAAERGITLDADGYGVRAES
jgi:predicted DNA-binding protein (UPF0278 family)